MADSSTSRNDQQQQQHYQDTSSSSSSTRTLTLTETTDGQSPEVQTTILKLRKPVSSRRVQWDEETVDNEHMNKKKSKCCCIYKKPVEFGDSSSEDESDEECDHCSHHVEKKKEKKELAQIAADTVNEIVANVVPEGPAFPSANGNVDDG